MTHNFSSYNQNDLLDKIDDPSIDIENESEDESYTEENHSRKLYIDKVDKSMSDLFRMIKEGELNLQPDFQRRFIWDKKTMSRFIESLLLSIPIPTIFLSENLDDTYDVIDGQQRLTTIFSFMKSSLNTNELDELSGYLNEITNLKLSGLDTLKEFNNKEYIDLDEKKRKFNNVSIPVVIIKKDSSEDIKYDIFSRINRGSIKLNNQELLNVMYRGTLIDMVNEIANLEIIDEIFEKRPVLKKRFGYQEIILRTIAMECFIDKNTWDLKEVAVKNQHLLKKEKKKYNGRLNLSIIDYLTEYRDDHTEAARMRDFILDAVEKVQFVFGNNAFKRINKKGSTSINKTVAETQLITLSRFSMPQIKQNKEKILNSFNLFLENDREDIFTKATNNSANVTKRYEWGKSLNTILSGE